MVLSDRPGQRCKRARRIRRTSRLCRFSALLLVLLAPVFASASNNDGAPVTSGFWEGTLIGLVLAVVIAVFARTRVKSAERESIRLKELANHREYERNLAQQELVRR